MNIDIDQHFQRLWRARDSFSAILEKDLRLNKRFPDMRVESISVYKVEISLIETRLCEIVDSFGNIYELIETGETFDI